MKSADPRILFYLSFNLEQGEVPREFVFLARTLPKMAVTRSSSAKKVVCKAVAVKVTKSSGRKYVSWDDSCNQLIAFWKKEGHVALISAPRSESGVPSSDKNSRPIILSFLKNASKSCQPLAFSSVFK